MPAEEVGLSGSRASSDKAGFPQCPGPTGVRPLGTALCCRGEK